MKTDFNKNVFYSPKTYTGVIRQQARPAVDADFQETQNAVSTAELKQTTRTNQPSDFGERVLLAQLQKAELNSRQTPSHGALASRMVLKPVELEHGLVDSREDVRRHRERLGNLLAKLHGESALPNREKIVKDIQPALADLSKAMEKNIALLTKFKGGLEKLRPGADALLETAITDIAMEIRENRKQLRNCEESFQS